LIEEQDHQCGEKDDVEERRDHERRRNWLGESHGPVRLIYLTVAGWVSTDDGQM
jgi:hypothetical protein